MYVMESIFKADNLSKKSYGAIVLSLRRGLVTSNIIINDCTGGGSGGDMLLERKDGMFEASFEERIRRLAAV